MSASRHLQRLSAFENAEDPSFSMLQSKIGKFQKKQQRQSKKTNDKYNWIQTQRKLQKAEDQTTREILTAVSNLSECLEKEKDLCESCGVDRCNRVKAMDSLQEDMATLQTSAHANQGGDVLSQIIEVREAFHREQSDGDTWTRERSTALHAQWLLELKESLVSTLEGLDEQCNHLSREIKEDRKNAVVECEDANQHRLPESLSRALASLAAIDDGEIDFLESELQRNLDMARKEYDLVLAKTHAQTITEPPGWDEKSRIIFKKALSSKNGCIGKVLVERLKREIPGKSEQDIIDYFDYTKQKRVNCQKAEAAAQEYKKKCYEIERRGFQDIEGLKQNINEKSKRMKSNLEQELKRKEMKVRLLSMRVEREDAQKAKEERQEQAAAKKASNDIDKELQRTKHLIETKQRLMKHKMQQTKVTEGSSAANSLQNGFADEIENLIQQEANKERTKRREEQMRQKLMAKDRADVEALREEECRLERLNSLAASVPYYKSIMQKEANIHKSTKARENDFYMRNKLPAFQSGKQSFFSTERLETNANFRLSNELHAAGLANSTYARDVVRNAIPRSEERTTGIKPY